MTHILRTLRERIKLNCSFGRESSEQAKQKAKASQEAVPMFAEYQKKQLLEARLISVGTPLLAAMLSNQGVACAASLTAGVGIEMTSHKNN